MNHMPSVPGNSTRVPVDTENDVLRIGVLYPKAAWVGGAALIGAAYLAQDNVNRDASLLPGRKLEVVIRDSGCSASSSLQALTSILSAVHLDGVIGPACTSSVSNVA